MPELPDVEGFRRLLERHGRGQRIRDVEVLDDTVVRNTNPATLRRGLVGRRLEPPERRGKWLVAPTDSPTLLLHFGMTGSLEWDSEPHRHDRVVFHLDGGELRYRDQRKLQGLWLIHDDDAAGVVGRQGPDAFGLTNARLREQLAGKRAGVKAALMDQRWWPGWATLSPTKCCGEPTCTPTASPRLLPPPSGTGSTGRSDRCSGRRSRRGGCLSGGRG